MGGCRIMDETNTEFFTPQDDENGDIVVQIKTNSLPASHKSPAAVITGGDNGLLGPIWKETLLRAGYWVGSYDLPSFDVRYEDDIEIFFAGMNDISILVNNAAIDNPPGSDASFFGNFDKIMDVNINGAARMAKAVIPSMIKNGGGVIINVGSIQGRIGADWRNYQNGFEKPCGYNCSKAAMEQLTRSIAVQYGRYNIRSVCIAFGPYNGGKLSETFLDKFLHNVPLGRTISKESLQKTLMYAIECPELTGQTIMVDGGYTAW
jgi:NAD(P)-dependent dehydrogenase (short-subunit alcohol dehydrogenase family)